MPTITGICMFPNVIARRRLDGTSGKKYESEGKRRRKPNYICLNVRTSGMWTALAFVFFRVSRAYFCKTSGTHKKSPGVVGSAVFSWTPCTCTTAAEREPTASWSGSCRWREGTDVAIFDIYANTISLIFQRKFDNPGPSMALSKKIIIESGVAEGRGLRRCDSGVMVWGMPPTRYGDLRAPLRVRLLSLSAGDIDGKFLVNSKPGIGFLPREPNAGLLIEQRLGSSGRQSYEIGRGATVRGCRWLHECDPGECWKNFASTRAADIGIGGYPSDVARLDYLAQVFMWQLFRLLGGCCVVNGLNGGIRWHTANCRELLQLPSKNENLKICRCFSTDKPTRDVTVPVIAWKWLDLLQTPDPGAVEGHFAWMTRGSDFGSVASPDSRSLNVYLSPHRKHAQLFIVLLALGSSMVAQASDNCGATMDARRPININRGLMFGASGLLAIGLAIDIDNEA
ncbi:hypothetical protein BV22DRAFT_1049389 [Leucogyrophana mollusca]|uniref:Uncharacterized protein n=1 Tax=Leucogyrophana mollusca TaxID=85980 RepID=A0ACB8B980_9AGAM|nr:hypothetical protein BV22DRAFT_1049389 [Leucogyrophana mollusca]